jgi:fatty-acyl-CoA synthase
MKPSTNPARKTINPVTTPAQWIEGWAAATPDQEALRFEGASWSYNALSQACGRVAALLAGLGIERGDRIAYLGFNSAAQLMLLIAASRLGAAVTPLNWRLAPPEHAYMLADAGAKALFCDPDFAGGIEPAEGRRDVLLQGARDGWLCWDALIAAAGAPPPLVGSSEDLFLIVYTSGTTGRPKGAALTQGAIHWNARNSLAGHGLSPTDRVLTLLPLFHVGAINIQTLPAFMAGATVLLHPKADPIRIFEAFSEFQPTLTVVVPAVMRALIEHPGWAAADFSSLRAVTTGSSIVPLPLIEAFHERGAPVIQVYGATETAPIATIQTPDMAFATIGTVGKEAAHCRIRIVDSEGRDLPDEVAGEILVFGPSNLDRYWNDSIATRDALRDGWYHSGDIGYRRPDGCFVVVDRKKDIVISGGENIYPAEIEAELERHADIAEVAVVGQPDERWGETPVAFVVARADLTEAEILARLDGRLARFKWPRAVRFVEALPRNAMGKIQKAELRARLLRSEG